jgi:hypothetical protein
MLFYKDTPDISPVLPASMANYCPALVPGFEGSLVNFPSFLFKFALLYAGMPLVSRLF